MTQLRVEGKVYADDASDEDGRLVIDVHESGDVGVHVFVDGKGAPVSTFYCSPVQAGMLAGMVVCAAEEASVVRASWGESR